MSHTSAQFRVTKESHMKILVATDCHLGYEEHDRIIGNDSFVTFEEVLTHALDQEVDFILLGGDLFHHNNPSQKTMNTCIELLRKYTFGNKPIMFELLSSAVDVFHNSVSQVPNFLDENINISIPVFSIHGNHDDPNGLDHQGSLDTLSSAGFVNYFGKWTDLTEIKIKPIILRKGGTYLALYGLSHIKDDRLCRLFIDNKVTFLEPEVNPEKCFRILVLHQNRADRGPKRFISESFIPEFFHLIIWGHEHDSEIDQRLNIEKEFYVIQPGSTVPTSLCEGEAKPKHIGILHLWRDFSKFEPIKLKTVRPFVWKSIRLSDVPVTKTASREVISEAMRVNSVNEVENMIQEAKQLISGHPKQPKLPLIRLRCEFTDETQLFNSVKFGQQFLNRVATPNLEIIRFKKVDCHKKREKTDNTEVINQMRELFEGDVGEVESFTQCVNRIVRNYFTENESEKAKLSVLKVSEMGQAVERFIEKEENDIIKHFVGKKLTKVLDTLGIHKFVDEEDVERELGRLKEEENASEQAEEDELDAQLKARSDGGGQEVVESDSGTDEYDADVSVAAPPVLKGRASASTTKKQKRAAFASNDSDSDEFEDALPMACARGASNTRKQRETHTGRGRGRGRGRGAAKKTSDVVLEMKSPKKGEIAFYAKSQQKKTEQPSKAMPPLIYDDFEDSD